MTVMVMAEEVGKLVGSTLETRFTVCADTAVEGPDQANITITRKK
jgi:hypothetical protein